ncbi:cupin domain-containing protein [Muricoccus radiodurans]|uniref:cupin domain-containing protein n=1 Tax=Muricoccus radiodurans TaxID=2231721 RepID=UPI003CEA2170
MHHVHSRQDEFIYVPEGEPPLHTDRGEARLRPGMVAGFLAGGTAHHLENRTDRDCVIPEIGDRTAGDTGSYRDDDLRAVLGPDGQWNFTRKDGKPW